MTETAAARLRRMLLLIPHLADGDEHSVDELARALGTDRETVVRDIETLVTRDDDPGGFVPGVHVYLTGDRVGVTTLPFRRPMRLTSSELCALELGLAMLRTERPPDDRAVVNRALERLRQAAMQVPSDVVVAPEREGSGPHVANPQALAAVKTAMTTRRKIRIRYRGAARAEATDRTVDPYALVIASGRWFVIANCESAGDLRSFRLDRMETVAPTNDPYDIPMTFSVDQHLNDRKVLRAGAPASMRVRYSARIARWIAEREDVPVDADGSLTMTHPLLDVQWGVRHVLQYGPDAEVLEPADVRAEVARRLGGLSSSRS